MNWLNAEKKCDYMRIEVIEFGVAGDLHRKQRPDHDRYHHYRTRDLDKLTVFG